jgi:glycosyltransferase involved in cell wall biosynthesis
MNILHTVEYYYPSVGGAQEVVRWISEGLVARGHRVTVATTRLDGRASLDINGVAIREFDVAGNSVRGLRGECERYQRFLLECDCDVMMNYAAQEWTMDLAIPLLERLPYRKVMIPCGFSGLYDPAYGAYFAGMPQVMRRYDQLVFHASEYRDIDMARQNGLHHFTIIPNGASRAEFAQTDTSFRQRHGIPEESLVLLTVGSHTGLKGHRLCLEAFRRLDCENAVLVIVGNPFGGARLGRALIRRLLRVLGRRDLVMTAQVLRQVVRGHLGQGCDSDCRRRALAINMSRPGQPRVLLLNPPREEVVAAYHAADLFLLASNLEYSPLVLFEAMASRTPFLTLACGNAAEIAAWSGGGVVAPTRQEEGGFVDGDPVEFALEIDQLLSSPERRSQLAAAGHHAWLQRFTWEKLVQEYEKLYSCLVRGGSG